MRNNNSELIAFGLSVNFNWPPERHICWFLPASELHQQQTESMKFLFAFAPFFFFFLHVTLKPLFGFTNIILLSFCCKSLFSGQEQSDRPGSKIALALHNVSFPSCWPLPQTGWLGAAAGLRCCTCLRLSQWDGRASLPLPPPSPSLLREALAQKKPSWCSVLLSSSRPSQFPAGHTM